MLIGPVVEVKEAMGRFTTDVITSCAFGIDSNSLKNPEAEFRRYLRNIFGPSVRQEIVSLMAFFAPHFQNFIRLKFLDDNTSNFIRRTVWRTVEYRWELVSNWRIWRVHKVNNINIMRFYVFVSMKLSMSVFWVATLCGILGRYLLSIVSVLL